MCKKGSNEHPRQYKSLQTKMLLPFWESRIRFSNVVESLHKILNFEVCAVLISAHSVTRIPALGLKPPVLDTVALNKDSTSSQRSHKKKNSNSGPHGMFATGAMPDFRSGARLALVPATGSLHQDGRVFLTFVHASDQNKKQ